MYNRSNATKRSRKQNHLKTTDSPKKVTSDVACNKSDLENVKTLVENIQLEDVKKNCILNFLHVVECIFLYRPKLKQ